jgi:hypothetical protein
VIEKKKKDLSVVRARERERERAFVSFGGAGETGVQTGRAESKNTQDLKHTVTNI